MVGRRSWQTHAPYFYTLYCLFQRHSSDLLEMHSELRLSPEIIRKLSYEMLYRETVPLINKRSIVVQKATVRPHHILLIPKRKPAFRCSDLR